jgi:hypothetical protein
MNIDDTNTSDGPADVLIPESSVDALLYDPEFSWVGGQAHLRFLKTDDHHSSLVVSSILLKLTQTR